MLARGPVAQLGPRQSPISHPLEQHLAPRGLRHGAPSGWHPMVVWQTPFVHAPSEQHGWLASQALPTTMQSWPQIPLLPQGEPEQQGWVASQSPPSGMQTGCGSRHRPAEQVVPWQQG
jgi:hypothetical protein